MNIQEKIDATEAYGTLVLEFDEHVGQIVIDKPMMIDGKGSTICSRTGPVLSIHSEKVELRNLRLEVTSASDSGEDATSLALFVKEDIGRVKLENVVVKGNVSGLINQDGSWAYPDVLHIWPVVPKEKNHFVFNMNVPVSCVLETDITGLKIVNPGLNPGPNTVCLEVENLKQDAILFGEIEIISIYLTRLISVSGGSFGISSDFGVPKKNRPIDLSKGVESLNIKKQRATDKDKKKRKGNKGLWLGAIAIVLIISGLGYSFLMPSQDNRKPAGKLSGVKDIYTAGETMSFTIHADDDQSLRKIAFRVNNTSVDMSWHVSGRSSTQDVSFSTRGWDIGSYDYSLLIEDQANHAEEYAGKFFLEQVRYGYVNIVTRPWAEIHINGKSYGNTPQRKLKLPAGKTDIRFVNPSRDIDMTETIIVKPDDLIKKSFKLK